MRGRLALPFLFACAAAGERAQAITTVPTRAATRTPSRTPTITATPTTSPTFTITPTPSETPTPFPTPSAAPTVPAPVPTSPPSFTPPPPLPTPAVAGSSWLTISAGGVAATIQNRNAPAGAILRATFTAPGGRRVIAERALQAGDSTEIVSAIGFPSGSTCTVEWIDATGRVLKTAHGDPLP